VATNRKATTVGEILTEEFLRPMRLTPEALAASMGVSGAVIQDLCSNRIPVDADLARSLADALGNSPQFWLNIQAATDQHGRANASSPH
jgi:addiction module HigA family antidote